MMRLRYILIIVLSLLVIYSGVGVSVCSCLTCEVACLVCPTPCSGCEHDDSDSDATCDDSDATTCDNEGCSLNFYKVDLTNLATQSLVSIASFDLFSELLPDFQSALSGGETEISSYAIPPPLVGARHYLALYSVLVI